MIHWSLNASKAIALFFRYKNEVDIYYEDSNDEEFYKELLQRLFHGDLRVGKLISLGNKSNVINACASDQTDKTRKRIYIVDADLNLITKDNPIHLKHLHIHYRTLLLNTL